MLTRLDIQGLAIIDSLGIELTGGFNVITGETGAGKSILIKALSLLLGAKASADAIRAGVEHASVAGSFEIPKGHPSLAVLDRYGIPAQRSGPAADDTGAGEAAAADAASGDAASGDAASGDAASDECGIAVLVRRSVGAKGRSKAWVNDVPVTTEVLRELAETLIDVFGQHENLRLLDPSQHTGYVDRFVESREIADTVRRRFEACSDLERRLARMAEDFRARQRDADYLAFRLAELDEFDPSLEDHDAVEELCRRAGGEMRAREAFAAAQSLLDTGAADGPVSQALWQAAKHLRAVEDSAPAAGALAAEVEEAASRVDDLSFRVSAAGSSLEGDENELQQAQDRMAGYQALLRKLGVRDVAGLLDEHARLRCQLSFLESAAAEALEIARTLAERAQALDRAASKQSAARKKAAAELKRRVESELHELAMPAAKLDVELAPVARAPAAADLALFGDDVVAASREAAEVLARVGGEGAETARLHFAANAGEPPRPLHKIASGGEISRILLAIKKGLAAGADTCILVFDEIDTGISGRVADIVGRKMRELGASFQVICVSHLAQVAAYADSHFQVEKERRAGRTGVTIRRLDASESEEAVARLLSGREVSATSLENARTLIAKARESAAVPGPVPAARGSVPAVSKAASAPVSPQARRPKSASKGGS